MSTALIEALQTLTDVTTLDADSAEAYLADGDPRITALFFTGEPDKKKETADVAVVLRELLKSHAGRLRAGLVGPDIDALLRPRACVLMTPSLAFFAGEQHLETIPKIQDWDVYEEKLAAILAKAA